MMFPYFSRRGYVYVFHQTPPRSISTFDQLATKFLDQFRLHTSQVKDVMSLSGLVQGRGESLKAFMNRFNTVVMEVSNPNEDMVLWR